MYKVTHVRRYLSNHEKEYFHFVLSLIRLPTINHISDID